MENILTHKNIQPLLVRLYTVVLNVKPASRQMCDLCVGGLKEERVRETKRDETGGGKKWWWWWGSFRAEQ